MKHLLKLPTLLLTGLLAALAVLLPYVLLGGPSLTLRCLLDLTVLASLLAISVLAAFARAFAPSRFLFAISLVHFVGLAVSMPHTLADLGLIPTLPLATRVSCEVVLSALLFTGLVLMIRSSSIRKRMALQRGLIAAAAGIVGLELALMLLCLGQDAASDMCYFAHVLKLMVVLTALWLLMRNALGEPYLSLFSKFKTAQLTLMRQVRRIRETDTALKRYHDHYLNLLDEFPGLVWRSDVDGNLEYLNEEWLSFTGRSLQEQLRTGWHKSVHPEDLEPLLTRFAEASKKREPFSLNYRLRKADGQYRLVSCVARPLLAQDGGFGGYIGSCTDVTDREESERARMLSEYSLDNSGVCTYWIASDGSFINANKAGHERLGYSKDQLLAMKVYDLYRHVNEAEWTQLWAELRVKGQLTYDVELVASDGTSVPFELHLNYLKYGDLEYNLMFAHDISARRCVEEELKFLTFHDRLTGLYNRAYFEEELNRLDTDRQLPLSLVVGDVNGLRLINDTLGRDAGNEHLIRIALSIRQACRKEDILARWGGDEFAILLPRTEERVAHEICRRIGQICKLNSAHPLELSIALGYGTKTDPSQSIHEILSTAESWMYRQKLLNRSSYRNALIASLRETLNARTHETHEHATRLENLASMVGRAMNLSARELDDLSLLAALHDIGKVGIPDNILNKPGELTDDEWKTMRTHVEIGHRIASSSPDLVHIAEAILSHHERWDGGGYPRGLKGEEIPLIARILTIVDAYDAITNDRPHSSARTRNAALNELRRCAGTHFDPNLVEVFVRLMSRVDAEGEHLEAGHLAEHFPDGAGDASSDEPVTVRRGAAS